MILYAVIADLPSAGIPGRLFFASDTGEALRDNGTTWNAIITSSFPQIVDSALSTSTHTTGLTHTAPALPVGLYRLSVYVVCTATTSSPSLNATLNYTDTSGAQANEIINQEFIPDEFIQVSALFYNASASATPTLVFVVVGTITYIVQGIVIERLA